MPAPGVEVVVLGDLDVLPARVLSQQAPGDVVVAAAEALEVAGPFADDSLPAPDEVRDAQEAAVVVADLEVELGLGQGPDRTKSSRVRLSIGEPEPTRIHRSASRSTLAPRGLVRRPRASAKAVTVPSRAATASPSTTRSSSPSRSARSHQVSASPTTGTP